MTRILVAALLTFVLAFATRAESPVIAPDAKIEKLGEGFGFTEGPTADRDGNVFFTDQPNDRIMKWSADDKKITTFMQPAGRSNGMYFDKEGNLISCADDKNELWLIDMKGGHTVLVKDFEGKLMNGPNDVWQRPDGAMYMTDPYYKRPWWAKWNRPEGKQIPIEGVYFLSADHKTLTRVVEDLKQPNGITGTPDGKTLYVADIGARKTYQYDIQADGKLANKKLFCELGSDGMTLDSAGNLYLTGKGVTVFDKTGKQIEQIDVPGGWTANVCFGGKDRNMLFITTSKAVWGIQMKTKGVHSK